MTDEINATQRSIYTQFSLSPILRNRNAEKDSNEAGPVGDINNQTTPPTESSHQIKKADNARNEAAQIANESAATHSPNKLHVKYHKNGALKELTYEGKDKIPTWLMKAVVGNYQKVEKLGRTEKNPHTEIDLSKLAENLLKLISVLKTEAKEPEHQKAIEEVINAEKAAKANDSSKTFEKLKKAGHWVLNVSEKIGVPLATAALKTSLGL